MLFRSRAGVEVVADERFDGTVQLQGGADFFRVGAVHQHLQPFFHKRVGHRLDHGFEREQTEGRYRTFQCAYGAFRRSVQLPAAVIADQAQEKKRVNDRFDEELARLKPLWSGAR